MDFNRQEMIDQLKFEILMIERGGYNPSIRDARHDPEVFRDSITCLNVGLEEKVQPCSACFLSAFVPAEERNSKADLCHKIPLNQKGDTIESLEAEGDTNKLRASVLIWLKTTVARLEQEAVESR